MTVSIGMVTYNRLDLTKQTLSSLFETTDYPFELVVVDNASTDGTMDYLLDFCGENLDKNSNFQSFKIHCNEKNLGIAVGRNQCLKMADEKVDWYSTIDNDVILPQGWLSQAVEILRKNPRYGMIGVNMENTTFPLVKSGVLEWQDKPRGNLGTACTVFHKSLHKMLGYFTTDFGLYGEEDADFGFRVRMAGFRLGYLKENGKHLGEGERDVGAYREFKTASHRANLQKFNETCSAYANGKKSLYISFKL